MAAFSISEAESPLPLQPGASPRSLDASNCRDWEEVSCALLEDGFILTALELHTELLECGREVSTLKDYFSNPGNFEHAIPQPPSSSELLCTLEMWAWPEIIPSDPGFLAAPLFPLPLCPPPPSSSLFSSTCMEGDVGVCTCTQQMPGGVCEPQLHPPTFSLAVRTSSLSTFDSIELGRYSDDGNKETEDRVAGTRRRTPRVTGPPLHAQTPPSSHEERVGSGHETTSSTPSNN